MARSTFTVLQPGLLTTVQDTGRTGHLRQGITIAGAADNWTFRATQALVGNPVGQAFLVPGDPGAAGLEFTLMGPTLQFNRPAVIVVGGWHVVADVDGKGVTPMKPTAVRAGEILQISKVARGLRGYLSVAGGIDVPQWLGSRATYLGAARGGFEGRPLQAGDVLTIGDDAIAPPRAWSGPELEALPSINQPLELRVVRSHQAELLEPESLADFFAQEWTVDGASNRVACRLQGPALRFRERPAEVIAAAGSGEANVVDAINPPGAIQVIGGNTAIAFGVDVTSTGGYAHAAYIVTSDISRLAQCVPGSTVRFQEVSVEEGDAIYEQLESQLVTGASLNRLSRWIA